jgi:hypothetical protein
MQKIAKMTSARARLAMYRLVTVYTKYSLVTVYTKYRLVTV